MSEIKDETLENPPLLSKRKGELECLNDDKKKKKSEVSDISPPLIEENIEEVEDEEEEDEDDEDDEEDEDEDGEEDEDEDDEEDEDEVKEVASNGKAAVDKGKGIMKEDKGKGKLKIEEGGEDGDGGDDNDDSDLSDDPLAEVDLNNILPSRTRRRVAQPGAYLVNDLDGEDDDSDDSE